MKSKALSTALVAALGVVAMAAPGLAQPYGYDNDPHYASYRYYADQCGREKHNANVAGTVLGGLFGALIGNSVSRGGGRAGGTIIGGVAGAAAGSNIARSTVHCDGPKPYWTYEQTIGYDAYNGYPGRYDRDWYWRHHCRWVQTERGDYLRVCPRGDRGYFYPEY